MITMAMELQNNKSMETRYFNIEYKGSDEEYTNQLKNSWKNVGQPWRDIHTFFSFMKEKFHDHYIQTNEKIGFNPHSCEYDIV